MRMQEEIEEQKEYTKQARDEARHAKNEARQARSEAKQARNTAQQTQQNNNSSQNQKRKIGHAIQNGSSVFVYDEKGSYLFSCAGKLDGYSSSSVSIISSSGHMIYVYNETGNLIRSATVR